MSIVKDHETLLDSAPKVQGRKVSNHLFYDLNLVGHLMYHLLLGNPFLGRKMARR